MKLVPLADVQARLSAYVEECETEGPVIITQNGRNVAVLLVPLDDDDLERLVLERSPRFQALLDKSRQSIKANKGLSRAEFWQTVKQRNHKQENQKPVSIEDTAA